MKVKPFYESIVDQINEIPTHSEAYSVVYAIANLIARTQIRDNHDEIRKALTEKTEKVRPYFRANQAIFDAVEKALHHIKSQQKFYKPDLHPYREGPMA